MSSSDERNARSPAAKSVQQRACSRPSHEHYQAPMQRDDGTAATREVVPEGSIGTGKTGSPSPGGGQQNQPIYGAEKKIWNNVNKHQEQRRGQPTQVLACRSPTVSRTSRQTPETRETDVKGPLQPCAGRESRHNVSQATYRSVHVNGNAVWAWCA